MRAISCVCWGGGGGGIQTISVSGFLSNRFDLNTLSRGTVGRTPASSYLNVVGTVPDSMFELKSRYCSPAVNRARDGICPHRWLWSKSIHVSAVSEDITVQSPVLIELDHAAKNLLRRYNTLHVTRSASTLLPASTNRLARSS